MKINYGRNILGNTRLHLMIPVFLLFAGVGAKQLWGNTYNADYLLILNTYTPDASWSNAIITPILEAYSSGNKMAVYIEHTNMLMLDDSLRYEQVKEVLFAKYDSRPPKAVMMLGNPMLLFKDDIRRHWGDVPLILCAEEDFIGPPRYYIQKKPIPVPDRIPLTLWRMITT